MGGRSDEREVSLSTGRMIMSALDAEKYNAYAVDTACFGVNKTEPQDGRTSLDRVVCPDGSFPRPDVAFIALHGKFGEDGTVQGLLELLEIPYVGSGVLASALAMDKNMARKVMLVEGIPVPKGIGVRRPVDMDVLSGRVESELGYPVVVKPSRQGSTIGLTIPKTPAEFTAAVELAFKYDDELLIEKFIKGTEITVPVIGNDVLQVLPIVEIVPEGGFYDYHAKYTAGATDEIVPARIPAEISRRAEEIALACHKALGCRGMSRTDMMIRNGEIFVLEINTIPGMTPTSLLPRAAQAAGIEFSELLDRLIGLALER